MAIAHHDFDKDRQSDPSCSFKLGGKLWHCRPSVPYALMRDLVAGAQEDGSAPVQIETFFRSVLVEKEVTPFVTMMNAANSALDMDLVRPIIDFVTESLLQRPTKRPDVSSPGSPKTTRTSKGASSSPARPRRVSTA